MLFNSFSFVLLFLPVALIGFFAASRAGKTTARVCLAFASFAFYIWWYAPFAVLLLISIVFNYSAGLALMRTKPGRARSALLAVAVATNLVALGYYKYAFAFFSWLTELGTIPEPWMSPVLLPLGISFFTFTQIGFLLDTRDGAVKDSSALNYVLFVTFFPHLIAGPILHHKEVMPQFAAATTYRFDPDNFARGFSLFTIGMLKKVWIADTFSATANAGFTNAGTLTAAGAWSAVLCYSIQLYFDFSGYSDMAIGIARMFNVRFPLNFNSPYRATNIIDFWARWHMTLTRYLTMYLFNPIAVRATRRLAAQGRPITRKALARPAPFLYTVVVPVAVTMGLAGVWHGAGSQFLVFGLLHAGYLIVNHTWRTFGPATPANARRSYAVVLACGAATYLAVLVGQVFFRAASSADALRILGGMVGLHGSGYLQSSLRVPDWLPTLKSSALVQWLTGHGLMSSPGGAAGQSISLTTLVALIGAYLLVWFTPNSQTICGITGSADKAKQAAQTPAGTMPEAIPGTRPRFVDRLAALRLGFSPRAGAAIGAMAAAGLLLIGAKSEFLYFQF